MPEAECFLDRPAPVSFQMDVATLLQSTHKIVRKYKSLFSLSILGWFITQQQVTEIESTWKWHDAETEGGSEPEPWAKAGGWAGGQAVSKL